MLRLDASAAEDDPTAVVEEYVHPWWKEPQEDNFSVTDGLEQFLGKVGVALVKIPRPADLL